MPRILTAKRDSKQVIVGEGEHKFEVLHGWGALPDKYSWQTTHNVALDKAGNLYVIHEGRQNLKDHPSIFVFDPEGKFIRRYLPQLAALPTKALHAPWLARPLELQEAGVRLGDTYPLPVVEHDAARQRTLERYAVVKTAGG